MLVVKPRICKVNNANRFPVIWNLTTCRVYDVSHFVCNDELQILHAVSIKNIPGQRTHRLQRDRP